MNSNSESAENRPIIDASRILRETFVRDVEVHEELASTNDHALRISSRVAETPHLIVARRQVRGRGRGANQWWSSEGALTFSLIVRTGGVVPPARWPEFSLATGAGVCAGVETLLPSADVRLKWPNDVFLNGRKVCGVLVEVPAASAGLLVIGVGLNVNNSLSTAPPAVRERGVALVDARRGALDVTDVLSAVLQGIAAEFGGIEAGDPARGGRWRDRCLLTGRIVTIHDGARTISGTCRGIEDDGSLLLETEAGPQRYYGGVVTDFS